MKPRVLPKLDIRHDSPLARLLALREKSDDVARSRRLPKLLEPFQLRHTVTGEVNGRHCLVNGRKVIHFGSANYLGLEQHPEVRYASKRAIDELGTDSGVTRLVSVHRNLLELEAAITQLLGAEATLLGQSTAQLHALAVPRLFGDDDSVLFVDKHAQPAMREAAIAATARGARVVTVDVSDPPALRRLVARHRAPRGALLVDGVYAIHGHSPDLAFLDELCRAQGLILYVDDTHGIGVLGHNGGGIVEAAGLGYSNVVVVGSLQAAFGTYGGFLTGIAPLVELLRLTAPADTGALQPSAVEGALASVRIARSPEGRQLREKLAETSHHVREQLRTLGFIVPPGDSPIVPVTIGRDLKTLMAGRKLFDLGVFVGTALYPEVPRGRGVLRLSLTTLHTADDLEKLFASFRELRHYLPKHENPLRQAAHVAFEIGKARVQGAAYAGL